MRKLEKMQINIYKCKKKYLTVENILLEAKPHV